MSFRPSQFCSCGVPSVHGLSGPAGLPLLRVSSSQFSVVECGVFVGCQCSHICVLPCTLCPLFCCLYILYVIASLCICNCLCLCTFFFVLAPYTNLHVLFYTSSFFFPWDCSHSFPCNLCFSFPRRHTALVPPIHTFGLSAFVARSSLEGFLLPKWTYGFMMEG